MIISLTLFLSLIWIFHNFGDLEIRWICLVGPGAHDMCVMCEFVHLISKDLDFYLFGCGLSIMITFVFYPFEFEDQKSRFSRKKAKMTFHIKSVHNFQNLRIMRKIYFFENRFFDDQLCLLRRFYSCQTPTQV